MPSFNCPESIRNIFNRMLGFNSNEEIQEFVKKYIGIPKYSYYQIKIFIKIFISQYTKIKSKLKFSEEGKDKTKELIEDFANCTKYFTNGGFSQLLTGIEKNEKNV